MQHTSRDLAKVQEGQEHTQDWHYEEAQGPHRVEEGVALLVEACQAAHHDGHLAVGVKHLHATCRLMPRSKCNPYHGSQSAKEAKACTHGDILQSVHRGFL